VAKFDEGKNITFQVLVAVAPGKSVPRVIVKIAALVKRPVSKYTEKIDPQILKFVGFHHVHLLTESNTF
jgi:hypothetical protein